MKALIPLLFITLSSCSHFKKSADAETDEVVKKEPRRKIHGRIASVSEAGKFVLIQKYGPGRLPKNTLFQSAGVSGSQANLRPTGERVRDFFAADILSGEAEIGDAVTGFAIARTASDSSPSVTPETPKSPPSATPND